MNFVPNHRRIRGFTLIELIVTVAIAAIVLSLAAAGFGELIARNRMTTAVNAMIADLQLARSEAVTRGIDVMLCPSPLDADSADPDTLVCAAQDRWDTGYVIFADDNDSGDRDIANEPLIRAFSGDANATITIESNHPSDQIIYFNDGSGSAGTFEFRDANGTASATNLVTSLMGRPRCERQCPDNSWKPCATGC